MTWIDFRDLSFADSSFSRLFVDYINDFSNVRNFFSGNFREEKDWRETIQRVAGRSIDRSSIVQVLSVQNRNFHCGVRTLANIDLLLNDNSLAVVTGQQVGLFTGPLYTIFKTLSVLKLTDQLSRRFPDYHFVPVFWLEGEDHDFDEVATIGLINGSNDLVQIRYGKQETNEKKNVGAVGKLELDESISAVFSTVDQALVHSEFKGQVLELFKTAYQPGMDFNRAFVHLLNVLLEDSGLVFLDPNDAQAKKIVAPIFERELGESSRTSQIVVEESAALEKQYHAQVKPRPINLFLFSDGGRYPIEPHPEGYLLKGTRRHLGKQEMADILHNTPERLSPNVVLRPICQDTLLPTVAYVGGPAEVAYFAQFRRLYDYFQIPEPIIYPRATATILEEKVEKVLTRFALQPIQFFQDVELLKQRVTEQVSDFKAHELFANTAGAVEESLNSLRAGMVSIDPTLGGALDGALGKMKATIDVLEQKVVAAQKRQNEVFLRQIDKAALFLFPNSNFQERELNILYFLNKYGPEFVRWLNGELEIDKFKHQIIRI